MNKQTKGWIIAGLAIALLFMLNAQSLTDVGGVNWLGDWWFSLPSIFQTVMLFVVLIILLVYTITWEKH